VKPNKFGRNLKEVMDALGMSQIDLANKSGMTPAAISQIISEKREPSLSTICLILQVIPVKFERLVQ
jgi:transcriptional regulator with XRE-family HTH domain